MRPALGTLGVLALVVAALVLYWSGWRYPPVFDDHVLSEAWLKMQLARAPSPFATRWVSDLSFEWAYRAGVPQRVVNVLLHAGTAAVLFGFLARLFGALVDDRRAKWLAFAGAAFFVLHPVAVYAIAYLVQRSIILATFFSLLCLWCVLEWLLRGARLVSPWMFAAVAAYYLAVYSKEHAVMLPAVAVALAVLVRGASLDAGRTLLLALLGAVGLILVLNAKSIIGSAYEPLAQAALSSLAGGRSEAMAPNLYLLSVLNQATLYFRYLATWLLPWPGLMSVDIRTAFPEALTEWPYVAGFAAWAAYPVAACWLLLRRGAAGLAGFGLLCPWLLALTEVATVRLQEPFVLYRSYLWMSGLPAVLPLVVGGLATRWRTVALAAACVLLIVPARDRLATFSSELALWDDAIAKSANVRAPFVERPYISRGQFHMKAGQHELALADMDRGIALNPRSPGAYLARGTLHVQRGALGQAFDDASRALAIYPGYALAYNLRCVVQIRQRRMEAALADCVRAVEIDSGGADAWFNRGFALRALGRGAEAAASYERGLAIAPADVWGNAEYGRLLFDSGRRDEVVRKYLTRACEGGMAGACQTLSTLP